MGNLLSHGRIFVMVSRVYFCSFFEFDLYLFNCNFIYYVNLVYDNKDFVVVVVIIVL